MGKDGRRGENPLKAVFWDHPELTSIEAVREALNRARVNNDEETTNWLLGRFLARGRVKDTAMLFSLQEIRDRLPRLRIDWRARKKWQRLITVYGGAGSRE